MILDSAFVLGLVALTSAGVFLATRRGGRLPAAGLGAAGRRLLECLGLVLAFYALNVGAGFAAVLVLRKVTGAFVSAYLTTDDTLAVLSALQAVAFQWWRAEGERR